MSQEKQTTSGGVGLLGLVFIVFLVLKLCGVIAWSWWWVTAPLWGPIALVFVVAILALVGLLLFTLLKVLAKRVFKMRKHAR